MKFFWKQRKNGIGNYGRWTNSTNTTCIPRWKDAETVVFTSLQRGIHVVFLLEISFLWNIKRDFTNVIISDLLAARKIAVITSNTIPTSHTDIINFKVPFLIHCSNFSNNYNFLNIFKNFINFVIVRKPPLNGISKWKNL